MFGRRGCIKCHFSVYIILECCMTSLVGSIKWICRVGVTVWNWNHLILFNIIQPLGTSKRLLYIQVYIPIHIFMRCKCEMNVSKLDMVMDWNIFFPFWRWVFIAGSPVQFGISRYGCRSKDQPISLSLIWFISS